MPQGNEMKYGEGREQTRHQNKQEAVVGMDKDSTDFPRARLILQTRRTLERNRADGWVTEKDGEVQLREGRPGRTWQ